MESDRDSGGFRSSAHPFSLHGGCKIDIRMIEPSMGFSPVRSLSEVIALHRCLFDQSELMSFLESSEATSLEDDRCLHTGDAPIRHYHGHNKLL